MLPSPLPAAQFLGRSIPKTQLCVLRLVETAVSQPFAAFVVIIIIVVWLLEERVSEGKMTHSKVMVWSSDRHSIQLLPHSLTSSSRMLLRIGHTSEWVKKECDRYLWLSDNFYSAIFP